MSLKTVEARVKAIEKVVGKADSRRDWSLVQLVLASFGFEVGPPERVLQDDEPSIGDLMDADERACRARLFAPVAMET